GLTEAMAHAYVHFCRGYDIENLALKRVRACSDLDRFTQVVSSLLSGGPGWPDRRISRNVDLLALRDQRIARQRIGILSADEHPYAPDRSIDHPQTTGIARRPHQLLIKCRNELAVVIEDRTIVADQQVRVPDAAHTCNGAFGKADRYNDIMPLGRHSQLHHLGAIEQQRLAGKHLEKA